MLSARALSHTPSLTNTQFSFSLVFTVTKYLLLCANLFFYLNSLILHWFCRHYYGQDGKWTHTFTRENLHCFIICANIWIILFFISVNINLIFEWFQLTVKKQTKADVEEAKEKVEKYPSPTITIEQQSDGSRSKITDTV